MIDAHKFLFSRKWSRKQVAVRSLVLLVLFASIVGLYVLSVAWRVGCAEEELFGRNCTLPLTPHKFDFVELPIAGSFGSPTYSFKRNGATIHVFKQLINGFQHAYGSALVAFEVGGWPSDLLFRLNEYVEAYTKKDGWTYDHSLDTRKDLFNNAVGRKIANEARSRGLVGRAADDFMKTNILDAMHNGVILNHYLDPRVRKLPTLDEYGCPGLPRPNEKTLD